MLMLILMLILMEVKVNADAVNFDAVAGFGAYADVGARLS
jgi:hypothetical protein